MLKRSAGTLALVAVAVLVSGSGCNELSKDCTALYAPSGASIQRTITTAFDASKPVHVELCFRDWCESGDFIAGEDVEGRRLCTSASFLTSEPCTLYRDDTGSWVFAATWDVTRESPQNGDRYRAKLTAAEGVLVDVDARASYEESEPNGEDCGITKRATL